jgi:formamidopyrimidine-DNA glycosylase
MLRPAMERARIDRVVLRRQTLRYPLAADFVTRLEGQTVRAVSRRAKYLLLDLSSGDALVMHLGMSGWFRVERAAAAGAPRRRTRGRASATGRLYYDRIDLDAHDHVVFVMSSGSVVVFNDPRRFGFMKILGPDAYAADSALSILGPEPLDRAFTADVLASRLKGKRTASLKVALLDQRVVAGLGNIYACEALHRARLSPSRKASTLVTRSGAPTPRAHALVDAIKVTLRDAIANRHRSGGADRFLVYDHEGQRCLRRGCTGTIVRRVQAGRSTFFCPVCQR